MIRLAAAAVVLLASVLGLVGVAAWNRAGTEQLITLTERELALPWTWESGRDEGGGLRLRFEWQRRNDPDDARSWLTGDALGSLGLNTGVLPGTPGAADFYRRTLPRVAWVVFELDGPAWRVIEQRALVAARPESPSFVPVVASRLVPIDAGLDVEALRRRHPGPSIVVMRAVVDLVFTDRAGQGPIVWGLVARLVTDEVSVPPGLRDRLRGMSPGQPVEGDPSSAGPRYEVDLAIGRLGVPWIRDVRRLR